MHPISSSPRALEPKNYTCKQAFSHTATQLPHTESSTFKQHPSAPFREIINDFNLQLLLYIKTVINRGATFMMLSLKSCICPHLRRKKETETSVNLSEILIIHTTLLFPLLFPTPAPLPLWISCIEAVASGEEVQEAPYQNKEDSS